ncbi:hypothetical protein EVAR_23257_1 [Eumeta japonica]|uniref:Uncharacterized protein n=1 Tax=Eumeta variegata TaxID=151549 RepID=A0A4C1V543_EUMVA|nr:hypothetical protein EVAR_23257_1 [Eumeta japonica]
MKGIVLRSTSALKRKQNRKRIRNKVTKTFSAEISAGRPAGRPLAGGYICTRAPGAQHTAMAAPRPLLPCLALLALAASAPVGPHLPTTVEISGSVVEVQRAFQNGLRSVTQTVRALLTDESSAASTATLKDDISTLREGVTGGISKLNESICQVHPPAAPSALRASLEKLEESFNDGLESLNFGADILATIRADKGADKDKEDGSAGGSGGGSGAGGSGSGSGAGGSGSESGSGDKGPFYAFQQFINNFQQTFQENMQNFNNTYQNYITQFSGQGNNTSNSQSSGDSNQNQLIQQIQQIGQNIQNAFGGGQQQQQQQQGQQQQQQQQQQQSDDQSSTTQRPFWQSISQGFQNSIQNIFRPGTSAQAPATAAATTAAADSTTAAPATAAQQTPEQDAPTAPPPGTQRYKGHWGGGHNNAAIVNAWSGFVTALVSSVSGAVTTGAAAVSAAATSVINSLGTNIEVTSAP